MKNFSSVFNFSGNSTIFSLTTRQERARRLLTDSLITGTCARIRTCRTTRNRKVNKHYLHTPLLNIMLTHKHDNQKTRSTEHETMRDDFEKKLIHTIKFMFIQTCDLVITPLMVLTEQHRNKVRLFDDFVQDSSVHFLDAIREVHGLQTGQKIQNVLFVH